LKPFPKTTSQFLNKTLFSPVNKQPISSKEEITINSPLNKNEENQINRLPIIYYDLEPDKTPEEWLLYCASLENSPHGFSPVFCDNKYEWKLVKVIGFNPEKMKFSVEFEENKLKKHVSRLALRFNCESAVLFNKRIELAKKLRNDAEEEIRFSEYVSQINEELVSPMNEKVNLPNRFFKNLKFFQFFLKEKFRLIEKLALNKEIIKTQPITTHLLKILMEEIEIQFILSGKKFLVLIEMENNQAKEKFSSLKIRIRNFPKNSQKAQGCEFRNFAYKFSLRKVNSFEKIQTIFFINTKS